MRSRTIATAIALSLVATVAMAPASDADRAAEQPRSPAAELAVAQLAAEVGSEDVEGAIVTDEYTSSHNGVTHVYLRQTVDGLEVRGAEATVNVKDGVVVYSGSRFVDDLEVNATGERVIVPDEAVRIAGESVGVGAEALYRTPQLIYRALGDGTARLAYRVELVTEHNWWSVSVDTETREVLDTADYVDSEDLTHVAASTVRPEDADRVAAALAPTDPIVPPVQAEDGSSYNVYALPLESPLDGDRSIVSNPADAEASPFGWHDTDGVAGPEHTITRGNNVNAYADTIQTSKSGIGVNGPQHNEADPLSQPDGGDSLTFDQPILSYDATPASYRDAAVTNLFYWNNVMHDVTFKYGFDEAAGNFQETNYSGEGLGADAVRAEAQDGDFVLNANFATPEDGTPGRMQMFLWVDAFRDLGGDVERVHSTQVRDGDVDAGVIAHEYGHGVSNRLVGGPSNVECLRTHDEREGEGWSDWWSYALTMRDGDTGATPRGVGNYVVYYDDQGRSGPGIRITPYSTDMMVNPSTYARVSSAAEPHGVGYVWATMLWDVYWALVDAHGFNPNPYESWETGGNNLAMQLVVDGMKFAPCEPGFADARDAILAADRALTGDVATGVRGENECLIWAAFARRGLGFSADQGDPASKVDHTEGYDVPVDCEGTTLPF